MSLDRKDNRGKRGIQSVNFVDNMYLMLIQDASLVFQTTQYFFLDNICCGYSLEMLPLGAKTNILMDKLLKQASR